MSLDEAVLSKSQWMLYKENLILSQTSSQLGTHIYFKYPNLDADSNMINWEVNQQYAQEVLYLTLIIQMKHGFQRND